MIALALLSLGFLAAVAAFKGISKGILVSKTKSLATNLAQEKIEFLKDKSYYRLRVSSSIVAVSGPDPAVDSDPYNYPADSLVVGGIPFTRYVVTAKVQKSATTDSLELVPWNTPDTGLKMIKVTVVWQESGLWKQLKLESLRENPSRATANVQFAGVVKDTANAVMANANVEVAENPAWRDATDVAGNYSFNLSPGTYTLRAYKTGYFAAAQSNLSVSPSSTPASVSFTLNRMSSGTIAGSVWIRDHLTISRVLGSSDSAAGVHQEYVEVFNPTTWTWTMNGAVGLKYQREFDAAKRTVLITYLNDDIEPGGFYLFASTSPIDVAGQSVPADAVWSAANPVADFPYFAPPATPNILAVREDGAAEGCAALELYDVATGDGIDVMGWTGNGSHVPPFDEGDPFPQGQGLNQYEQFYRYSSTVAAINVSSGPAYDSDDNAVDWNVQGTVANPPRSAVSSTQTIIAGTPAHGAYVFADDGLSSTVVSSNTGTPPYAAYTMTAVATGTWKLSASSGTLYYETSVAMTGVNLSSTVYLSSSTDSGYVSGQVTAVGGAALPGIVVSPGGGTTGGNGNYRLSVSPGPATITANPGGQNPAYVADSATVTVVTGQIVSGVNFTLSGGGQLRGKVTSDGTNALPDVPVSVTNASGLEIDNVLSQADGYFETTVPTGTYYAAPIAEFGEVVSPSSSPATNVTAGVPIFSSTFTIGPALGTIEGAVTSGGSSITTGVLIIASTSTVTDPPPDIDATLRSSGTLLYIASSRGDGTYSLDVRAGTYYVYGWYATFAGSTATTVRQSNTGVVVTAGNTTGGQDMAW